MPWTATAERARPRLALALGPGGTRGFAHLGVMKTLLAAGVPIDAVSGASAGALFGALFAMEGSTDAVMHAMQSCPREVWSFFRDRLRVAPSNPLGARLVDHFGAARIESLAVPLTILAVDLHSGEEVILREGSLRAAVEASIAIPLLAPPVEIDGRYLIDGGFGLHGPSASARAMGAEIVVFIGLGDVSLCPPRLRGPVKQVAGRLHRPGTGGPPDRRAILRRWLLTSAAQVVGPGDADLVIAPPLRDINPNSPFAAERAFRRGEQAARAALPALRRLVMQDACLYAPDGRTG
ncbi:MAG: patatin-like phospholipase family protein [Dehalococcoidia bacterium]